MKFLPSILLTLLAMSLTLGCDKSPAPPPIKPAPSEFTIPVTVDIGNSINQFSIDLLKRNALSNDAEANTTLSPQSIFHGLAMSYIASGGETRRELAYACYFPDDNQQLIKELAIIRNQMATTEYSEVNIANSLWIDDTHFDFNPEYISEVEKAFKASLHQIKYEQKEQAANTAIP